MSCFFQKGDCLDLLKKTPSNSIQLILWNPPFGTTKNSWDESLDWSSIFPECFRILKDDGMLVIHCSIPFNYELIRKAPKPPSYSWYWTKEATTNPFIAKIQPLRNTEEILVWKNKKNTYYPQRVGDEKRTVKSKGTSPYYGATSEQPKNEVIGYYQSHHITMKRPPLHGKNANQGFGTRPIEMIELMIQSYTKEGDTILDPTCHLGIAGLVSKRLKRKFIGFDKYFFPKFIMS
jgi:DNA modification methylase